MTDIKPIETRYNGHRFRSRLEARWAVYFDALGIKYDYEPEGFELPSGRYLPDFWLPQVAVYAEVKPSYFDADSMRKANELAKATGHHVLLLAGTPDMVEYPAVDGSDLPYMGWAELVSTQKHGNHHLCTFQVTDAYLWENRFWVCGGYGAYVECCLEGDTARIDRAISSALSARFEYGESGARRGA